MKFLFLLVFLLFSCFSVQAQLVKVSGKCVSKNNQGIQGVVIEVSTYKRNSFISDSTGEYTFFANRGDTLKVRYRFDGQFIQRETIVIESALQTIETVKFNVSNIRQITLVEEKKDPFELEYLKP